MIIFKNTLALFLIVFVQESIQQSSAIVFGVGYGVIVIGAGIILALILSLLAQGTKYPLLLSLFSFSIPVILGIIFHYTPKESQRKQIESQFFAYDQYYIPRFFYFSLMLLITLIVLLKLAKMYILNDLQAKRVSKGIQLLETQSLQDDDNQIVEENNSKQFSQNNSKVQQAN